MSQVLSLDLVTEVFVHWLGTKRGIVLAVVRALVYCTLRQNKRVEKY